jgi:hypothetical protein
MGFPVMLELGSRCERLAAAGRATASPSSNPLANLKPFYKSPPISASFTAMIKSALGGSFARPGLAAS